MWGELLDEGVLLSTLRAQGWLQPHRPPAGGQQTPVTWPGTAPPPHGGHSGPVFPLGENGEGPVPPAKVGKLRHRGVLSAVLKGCPPWGPRQLTPLHPVHRLLGLRGARRASGTCGRAGWGPAPPRPRGVLSALWLEPRTHSAHHSRPGRCSRGGTAQRRAAEARPEVPVPPGTWPRPPESGPRTPCQQASPDPRVPRHSVALAQLPSARRRSVGPCPAEAPHLEPAPVGGGPPHACFLSPGPLCDAPGGHKGPGPQPAAGPVLALGPLAVVAQVPAPGPRAQVLRGEGGPLLRLAR